LFDQIGGYLLKDPVKKKESRKKTTNRDRLMISAKTRELQKTHLKRKERSKPQKPK